MTAIAVLSIGTLPSDSPGEVSWPLDSAIAVPCSGIPINPYLNVPTSIVFEPYGGGANAVCAPGFALIASEINPVVKFMRERRWDIGCLYNQETDERPQLYFSHQLKQGDSVELAREIRGALNLMHSKFIS